MNFQIIFIIALGSVQAINYQIKDSTQLKNALNSVSPGDTINLEDGVYIGLFKAYRSGNGTHPIVLNGSRKAILTSGPVAQPFYLSADHWILRGFTVANSKKGIMLINANFNLLDKLSVHHIDEEAVHFQANSSDNTIQYSEISYTGLTIPGFGEGVYLSAAKSNWINNIPDRSNRNKVIHNYFGPNITAEAIDIKEGSESGLIEGNYFDGAGMTGIHYGDSWMEIKGSKYIIQNNYGTLSLTDGFQVYQVPQSVPESGCNNIIRNNQCNKLGPKGKCVKHLGTATCQNPQSNNVIV